MSLWRKDLALEEDPMISDRTTKRLKYVITDNQRIPLVNHFFRTQSMFLKKSSFAAICVSIDKLDVRSLPFSLYALHSR